MAGSDGIKRVYEMLRVLHVRGYEQLRIVPGMAPSGMHYRASITYARNCRRDNGARSVEATDIAPHSSANGLKAFAWEDAIEADTDTLVTLFLSRFPSIATRGFAPDRAYAEWFSSDVLPAVQRDVFPVAYADYPIAENGFLATTSREVRLRMPPPGLWSPDDERHAGTE